MGIILFIIIIIIIVNTAARVAFGCTLGIKATFTTRPQLDPNYTRIRTHIHRKYYYYYYEYYITATILLLLLTVVYYYVLPYSFPPPTTPEHGSRVVAAGLIVSYFFYFFFFFSSIYFFSFISCSVSVTALARVAWDDTKETYPVNAGGRGTNREKLLYSSIIIVIILL